MAQVQVFADRHNTNALPIFHNLHMLEERVNPDHSTKNGESGRRARVSESRLINRLN
jgi:hypothetical protein